MRIFIYKLFLFSLFQAPINSVSQGHPVTVTYNVSIVPLDKSNGSAETYNKLIEEAEGSINTFVFKLWYDKSKSLFKMDETLFTDNNEKSSRMSLILVGGKDVYYLDKAENIQILQKNFLGDIINIESEPINYDWELTNETKKIMKRECYKAVTYIEKKNQKGTYKEKVEAWYAPDLQGSIGPRNFHGLPGLILTLSEGTVVFYCTQIDFDGEKPNGFKKPESKIVMNEEEFDEYINKKTNEFLNRH